MYRKSIEIDDSYPFGYLFYATFLQKQKRDGEALIQYNNCLRAIDPSNPKYDKIKSHIETQKQKLSTLKIVN